MGLPLFVLSLLSLVAADPQYFAINEVGVVLQIDPLTGALLNANVVTFTGLPAGHRAVGIAFDPIDPTLVAVASVLYIGGVPASPSSTNLYTATWPPTGATEALTQWGSTQQILLTDISFQVNTDSIVAWSADMTSLVTFPSIASTPPAGNIFVLQSSTSLGAGDLEVGLDVDTDLGWIVYYFSDSGITITYSAGTKLGEETRFPLPTENPSDNLAYHRASKRWLSLATSDVTTNQVTLYYYDPTFTPSTAQTIGTFNNAAGLTIRSASFYYACGGKVPPCADGNAASGDGCSSTCFLEPGYVCTDSLPFSCVDANGCAKNSLSLDCRAAFKDVNPGLIDGVACMDTGINSRNCFCPYGYKPATPTMGRNLVDGAYFPGNCPDFNACTDNGALACNPQMPKVGLTPGINCMDMGYNSRSCDCPPGEVVLGGGTPPFMGIADNVYFPGCVLDVCASLGCHTVNPVLGVVDGTMCTVTGPNSRSCTCPTGTIPNGPTSGLLNNEYFLGCDVNPCDPTSTVQCIPENPQDGLFNAVCTNQGFNRRDCVCPANYNVFTQGRNQIADIGIADADPFPGCDKQECAFNPPNTCGTPFATCSDLYPDVPVGFYRCTCQPGTIMPGINGLLFNAPAASTVVVFPPSELFFPFGYDDTPNNEIAIPFSLSTVVFVDSFTFFVLGPGPAPTDISLTMSLFYGPGAPLIYTPSVPFSVIPNVGSVTDFFTTPEEMSAIQIVLDPITPLFPGSYTLKIFAQTMGPPAVLNVALQPNGDPILTVTTALDGSYTDTPDGEIAPECYDINECATLQDPCVDIFAPIGWVTASCSDSTSDSNLPLNSYKCTCPLGFQVKNGPAGVRSATYFVGNKNDLLFPGCDSIICGDGYVGTTEECEPSLQASCKPDCTCYGPGRHNVANKVGEFFPAIPFTAAVGPPPAEWTAPRCDDTNPPIRFCGDGTRDTNVEECESGPGCDGLCLCDQGNGYYPYADSSTCGTHLHRHYAIGHPDTYTFFFHTTYCNSMSYERRLTRWPWVTVGDLDCLEDPLDLGYMGLRMFPLGDWDGLRDMENAIAWTTPAGPAGVVNAPSYCNQTTTWDIGTITVNSESRPLQFPGNSQLNTRFWWEAQDKNHMVKVRSIWDCETMVANRTCRRIITVTPIKETITDLTIQLSFSHDINHLDDSQLKLGINPDSDPTLVSYAAVREIRTSEVTRTPTGGIVISPFTVGDDGDTTDVCFPLANTPYDWSYKVGGPFRCFTGGSVQLKISGDLMVGDVASVTTDLTVFHDSIVADIALKDQNPLFYEMVSHNPDPSLANTLPAPERRVVATFTGPLVSCKVADAGPDGCPVPGNCPCMNGGTCANGSWGGACACPSGWVGELCEIACPCKNGGTCMNSPASTCTCPNPYCGALCETKSTCAGNLDPLTCECFCGLNKVGKDCSRDLKCADARQSETSVKASK